MRSDHPLRIFEPYSKDILSTIRRLGMGDALLPGGDPMPICVSCLATSPDQVSSIIRYLNEAGFAQSRISVLLPGELDTWVFADLMHTRLPEPTGKQSRSGSMLSGIAGWTMGLAVVGWTAGLGWPLVFGTGLGNTHPPGMSGPLLGAGSGVILGILIGLWRSRRASRAQRVASISVKVRAQDEQEVLRIVQALNQAKATEIIHVSEPAVVVPE